MFLGIDVVPVRTRTALECTAEIPSWRSYHHVERERLELAPGIWIIREQRWLPVSALDVAELLPLLDVEPIKRVFQFTEWHAQAVCNTGQPNDRLFFGVDDEANPALPPTAVKEARAVCRSCPVARACLVWALSAENQQADDFVTTGERFGIWAGTTGRQRERMQQQLRRGSTTVEKLVEGWLAELIGHD
jgi:WhiB family redox-sensing transcriptional regulator